MKNEQSKLLFTQYTNNQKSKYFIEFKYQKHVGSQELLHIHADT